MAEGEIQTIAKDFFQNVRESTKEKIVLEKIVDATIIDVSDVNYNPLNGEGEDRKEDPITKVKRKFKNFYFKVAYALKEPINGQDILYENYSFRFYEDKNEVWFGSEESACGLLVTKLKKYIKELPNKPSVTEVLTALMGRHVKITTEKFGPNKTAKIMIDSIV